METSLSWVLNVAHKKSKATLPCLASSRGLTDTRTSPCQYVTTSKKGCTGGKIQKKPSLSASLGLAKGYGYASLSWEM